MSFKSVITLAVLLSLGACATKNVSSDSSSAKMADFKKLAATIVNKEDRTNELLLFIDRFSNESLEVQKKIFIDTNHALAEDKLDLTERIKLAIMLALPSSRIRDTAKAQILLQDLLQGNNLNPTESALTSLFYEYVLDDIKQSQKNKEDLKRLDLSQQKLDALQQKYDALDKKLNDLKNIEKTISERDSKVINKQSAKP